MQLDDHGALIEPPTGWEVPPIEIDGRTPVRLTRYDLRGDGPVGQYRRWARQFYPSLRPDLRG